MTALELERRGLWIDRSERWPIPRGPLELGDDLLFEVSMRVELVGDGVDFKTWLGGYDRCAHCGDLSPDYGTCALCELARAKALQARAQRERPRAAFDGACR